MANRILKKSQPTDHHNYPTSMGGSNHEINISQVLRGRHEKFHTWAGNLPPCQLIRLLMLHGIGTKDPPPPATVENIFRITGIGNPTKVYALETFRTIAERHAFTLAHKAARFSEVQVLQELLITRETLHAMTNGGTFPALSSEFLSHAQKYFSADTATKSAISLCTEPDQDNELAWVKPMLRKTHERIVETLEAHPPSRSKRKEEREFLRILQTHAKSLDKTYEKWKEELESNRNGGG